MKLRCILKDGDIVTSEGAVQVDVRVSNGKVEDLGPKLAPRRGETVLDCSGFFIYPGLINSHDHLQFSLYPRLGEPPYENAYAWGKDLHARWRDKIDSIERIPFRLRLLWGAWKNLFSGVTYVVNHEPYSWRFRFRFPVSVHRRYTFAHSLQFEPNLARTLSLRKPSTPFMIHLAEGVDSCAASELSELDNLGGLDERTVAVHCVGISENDTLILEKAKSSVVWCPSSNMFLFGQTALVQKLSARVPFALGTDSTLTGSETMFDELRAAYVASDFPPCKLFELVTDAPRRIFALNHSAGELMPGGPAGLFLLKKSAADPFETLLGATPGQIMLLVKGGVIAFFDPKSFPKLASRDIGTSVDLNGRSKVVTDRRFGELFKTLRPFLGHYSYLNHDSVHSESLHRISKAPV
jgi:cytosine/adenosine deaminase-related metal-dependent hydrolase